MTDIPIVKNVIDISRELLSTPPFPDDPAPKAVHLESFESSVYQLTQLTMTAHAATHVDAPLHFIKNGADIASIYPDTFVGKCVVVDIDNASVDEIIANLGKCERLLLKGKTVVDEDMAKRLTSLPLKLLGVEQNSVGEERAPMAAHLALLEKGIAIIENLDLSEAKEGEYFLSAAPLKIDGCEGAPCRAILIEF